MANPGMTTKIQGTETIVGHTFNNPLFLWEALQAAGSTVLFVGNRRLENGNKRLAVLGVGFGPSGSWQGGQIVSTP